MRTLRLTACAISSSSCSVVLGMLPKLDLTGLPGDPPGMRYPVACLVSAGAALLAHLEEQA